MKKFSGNHTSIASAARNRWAEILVQLGIDPAFLQNRHGPCPGCGGRDRFRFDDRGGRGTWICSGGGNGQAGDGFQLLEHVHGWTRAEAFRAVAEVLGLTDGTESPPADPAGGNENQKRRRQREAAKLARRVIEASRPASFDHPYLQRKQIYNPRNLRRIPAKELVRMIGYVPKTGSEPLQGDVLVAPVGDWGGVTTLEFIDENGRKSALAGGKKLGSWWSAQEMPENCDCILIGEGVATVLSAIEATGWPGVAALSCGNLKAVAQAMRQRYPKAKIIILADLGNGQAKAEEAARAVGAALAVPDFGPDREPDQTDFNDLAVARGLDVVRKQIEAAAPISSGWQVPGFREVEDLEQVIDALAALDAVNYDRFRKGIAKRFNLRASTLDAVVRERRREEEESASSGDLVAPLPEPWPEPVNGAALLDEIRATLARYVILPSYAAEALALWVLGSYCYDAFRIWPKLLVTSPEKRCGKSTLREVIEAIARQAVPTSNITAAALFRVIDMARPTITIDEADSFLKDNDDLRGIINSGHTKKGAFVIRCEGDDIQPRRFSTWAPMAIFMIKLPADTIVDRSIVIQLRRKLPSERVARVPLDLDERCLPLRQKCLRWATDCVELLKGADPELPASSNDRMLDNWLPLFAIAEAAGGDWPTKARAAFISLAADDDDDGIGPQILNDIQAVFADRNVDRILSRDLVSALIEIDDAPWAEWRRGKPITPNGLARLLKPFGIKPREIRIGLIHGKGYLLDQFRDAFERYCDRKNKNFLDPPFQTATPRQARVHAACSDFQNATRKKRVAVAKPLEPASHAGCRGVAVENKVPGQGKNFGGDVADDDVEIF